MSTGGFNEKYNAQKTREKEIREQLSVLERDIIQLDNAIDNFSMDGSRLDLDFEQGYISYETYNALYEQNRVRIEKSDAMRAEQRALTAELTKLISMYRGK